MAGIAEADPERAELAAVLDAIHKTMNDRAFSAAELIETTNHTGDLMDLLKTRGDESERGPRAQLKGKRCAVRILRELRANG
jgi:alpha-D-ribose 1-methylphosphonate 5-triphosphate synthase subunit PhnG